MKCRDCIHYTTFQMISSRQPYGDSGRILCYRCSDYPYAPQTSLFVPIDKNKAFADLAHVCEGPDYSAPREVLKIIARRTDYVSFMAQLMCVEAGDWDDKIDIDYVTIPGLLRDKWIEWRGRK